MEKIKIPRTKAIKAGLPRYYTGEPCKYGHLSERYTISSACIECQRLRQKGKKLKEGKPKAEPEPELDYAQIGKAIMERMKQLEKHLERSLLNNRDVEQMKQDNKKLTDKIGEQHDQIERLNKTIARLNEQLQRRPASTVGNDKFKMSEIARIK